MMGTNVGTSSTRYLESVSRWGNFLKRHVLYNACFNGIWNQEKTETRVLLQQTWLLKVEAIVYMTADNIFLLEN